MKNQKGITLVALVITIIVLLILAGVSISLVIGNNGVLTQASNSVVVNKAADAKQALQMAQVAAETYYYTEWAKNSATVRYSPAVGTQGQEGYVAADGAYLNEDNGFAKQLHEDGYTVSTIDYASLFSSTGTAITITKNGETYVFANVYINPETGDLSYVSVTTGSGESAVTTPARVTVSNSTKTLGSVDL